MKKKINKNFTLTIIISILALIIMIIAAVSYKGNLGGNGFWSTIIIDNFSRSILGISQVINNNYGLGIIIFTLLIRVLILPLMIFQTKTTLKMQELSPELKKIQEKYPSKDRESALLMREEQSKLYKEYNVNPFISFLPLIIQMPILIALYQSIRTTTELQTGTFLWVKLGLNDPYYILPLLAALFTFASSYLVMLGQIEKNNVTKSMTYTMPIFIFFMAFRLPSAISIYWVVSNAFQTGQTWFIQNPFKLQEARANKKSLEKAKERAIKKAKRSKKK